MAIPGWGALAGRIAQWLPGKRDSLQSRIDKTKEDMADVINKTPFDNIRYERLMERLRKLEREERRAE